MDDVALTPVFHSFTIFLEMLRDMVASLSPIDAEMRAKATAPASTSPTFLFGCFEVLVPLTSLAIVTRLVMMKEVFLKKIDGAA